MKQAITRIVVLAVLLLNQVLVSFGWDGLPFGQDEIYEGVSSVATVVASIWAWWKNNSMTPEAQQADELMHEEKAKKKNAKKGMK